jgi:hypothetical protein
MKPSVATSFLVLPIGLALGCIDLGQLQALTGDGGAEDANPDVADGAARDGSDGHSDDAVVDGPAAEGGSGGAGGSSDGGSESRSDGGSDGGGSVAPPRLIAPMSGSTTTSRRPTLHWQRGDGADGAHVQICRDRACTEEVTSFDADGAQGRPANDLPVGLLYWHASSRASGATAQASTPTWQFTVGARSAPVDTSWGVTPDVDGDGRADIIVGAANGNDGLGRTAVYLGASGAEVDLVGPDSAGSAFGCSVASAGDVNGDGFSDVAVAACGSNRVFVYLGGAGGLDTLPAAILSTAGVTSVSGAGDVNGDGYADLLIAYQTGVVGFGALYLGNAAGVSSTPIPLGPGTGYAVGDLNGDGYADIVSCGPQGIYLGAADLSQAGFVPGWDVVCESLAGAGDVNGDGFADVIVVEDTDGGPTVNLYLADGANGLQDKGFARPAPGDGEPVVAGVGDVNGDGYADLVVETGLPSLPGTFNAFAGEAAVYLGSADPSAAASPASTIPAGASVTGAGDVNGDGLVDVVTMYAEDLIVYHGAKIGLSTTLTTPWSDSFGRMAIGVGDIDGDGRDDILTATPGDDPNVFVYLRSDAPYDALQIGSPDLSSGQPQIVSVGDVNHDGLDDVAAIPTPQPSITPLLLYLQLGAGIGPIPISGPDPSLNGFGASIAGPGDVNGDGYADVAVGDTLNEGRVYLYLGEADGLPASPTQTLAAPVAYHEFGFAMSAAGDVNHDGYRDLLVADSTSVDLYLGSASGLGATPASTFPFTQPSDYSQGLGKAGDVNGDSYDDFLIRQADGSLGVYLGGPGHLATTPAAVISRPSTAISAFACSFAAAGDVDGDGYADVIVGAVAADELSPGRAYLYRGGPAGLATAPAATLTIQDTNSRCTFVAGAGDPNGDGYADVLVGTGIGQFVLFAGSSAGLGSGVIFADPEQPADLFGKALQ